MVRKKLKSIPKGLLQIMYANQAIQEGLTKSQEIRKRREELTRIAKEQKKKKITKQTF